MELEFFAVDYSKGQLTSILNGKVRTYFFNGTAIAWRDPDTRGVVGLEIDGNDADALEAQAALQSVYNG